MRLVEGYYLRLHDGVVFYAKGLVHPPGHVVAYPKYLPSPEGPRTAPWGLRYVKYGRVEDQLRVIEEMYPGYLKHDKCLGVTVPIVPLRDVDLVFDPVERLSELRRSSGGVLERRAVELASIIAGAAGWGNVGVSGSLLVGLHTESSDIDLVVYGGLEEAYEALREAKGEGLLEGYPEEGLRRLLEFRGAETPLSLEELREYQARRVLEGYYRGVEYFIRLVDLEAEPAYCAFTTRRLGAVRVRGVVRDSSKGHLTPCRYGVVVEEVVEGPEEACRARQLYTLRGRFCELLGEGDRFEARGVLELVEYADGGRLYRVYLGYPGDYLRPIPSRR